MMKRITIYESNGETIVSQHNAPTDRAAARMLWVFLVENLAEGYVVELSNGIGLLTRPSGRRLPGPLRHKVLTPLSENHAFSGKEEQLYHELIGLANCLGNEVLEQAIADLDGWGGPVAEAKKAFTTVLAMRDES
jgi:hypothetical protein